MRSVFSALHIGVKLPRDTETALIETEMRGRQFKSESECKCLTCNQKPTGSKFSLLHEATNQTKRLIEKTKKKTIEQSGVRKRFV